MGRWTQYDEDDYRLPEGLKRVGYDADTQKYTFKDRNGGFWEGSEWAEEITKVSEGEGDVEAAPARPDGYEPLNPGEALPNGNRQAWRQLLPFFLIIAVFLLLVFRLSPSMFKPRPLQCPDHSRPVRVKDGDSCWAISQEFGTSLENLRSINPSVDCAALKPGQQICVPTQD